jgi:hypothetical protein
MQLMYCYDRTNSVYSTAFYVSVIYLNLMSCKVHHSRAATLCQIVANIPRGLSLTPPQDIEKEIKRWSLNKSSNLEKFQSIWGEMTYPWWRRILAAAILFYSDPKAGTYLMAPLILAFKAMGHCTKSLFHPDFLWTVNIICADKEWFSDGSISLKIAKWVSICTT